MESTQRRMWLPVLLATTTGLLLFLPYTTSSIHINIDDRHSLLSFKSLITKDPLGALSSWSSNSSSLNDTHSFCRWTGVTCSSSRLDLYPRRITMLRLRGLGLSGNVSPLLGNLSRLRVLDLSDNRLQGEIPSSLGKCSALRRLNMSANSLSGVIPPAIGNLSKLVILNIRDNNLSGTVSPSFANLARLAVFSIASNYVHGNIPPWLGNLTVLTDLNMAGNMLSGPVPPALSKLIHLRILNVAVNKLNGVIPPALCNMSSLEHLNFGKNQLSGSLPQDIGSTLPNLRDLDAFYNQLEGHIPASLSNISVLETIVLHGNKFQGPIPPDMGLHGRLTSFDVGNNELQATGPGDWDFLTSLTNCSNLVVVSFQLNNLSGILPSTFANLTLELERILMGGNQISGHIPRAIGRYYKLTQLELADNLFTGTIPSDIGKLYDLHSLLLFQNRIHGEIPLSLGNISRLNQLILSSNNLEGSIPATLGNLTELTTLGLSSNLLSGQIPQEIFSISSLAIYLDLSGNLLGGPISPHVGLLVNLGTVDLSFNNLSDAIPKTLGSCLELQFLYLEGNRLVGKIPKELYALRGLEELDLSNNKLSGPVPEFLESLQLLKYLNLSFNKLSGQVPAKGIFLNESFVSLKHNGMLCGGPVFFHFPSCPSLAPDKPPNHKLLHILLFPMVGAFIFLGACIAACYCCVNKSRDDARQGQENSTSPGEMFQRMSYAELYVATDSFSMENLVGSGSFGTVYKGTFSFGTTAVKVLDVQRRGATRSFISECSALKRIRHRKLIKVITVCDSLDNNGNEFKALVLQFISNGSLDKWIHPSTENEFTTLSWMQRLNIVLDVAEALEYLHHHINPPIVHCDVKPGNILLDASMVAHVSDFGIAKIMKAEESEQSVGQQCSSVGIKGTIGYLAPEYGMGTEISIEGDVYSYGVVLLEMLTGRRPTDTLFDDTTSLPKYVEMASPGNLLEIMDANVTSCENPQEMVELLIAPASRLGLACCRDSARKRVKMGDVVKELSAIKKACESKPSLFILRELASHA